MAKIAPFRGLRYSLERVGDPSQVISPPYDSISPSLQQALYARSPFNVIRLVLGEEFPGDDSGNNRYTRAAADFAQWQQDGILLRDQQACLYLYDQEFINDAGQRELRQGFMALVRLEDFFSGVIKPHEQTLPAACQDRLSLIQACQGNLSPIFSVYSDPCGVLEVLAKREKTQPPAMNVTDDDGVQHRLWAVSDPGLLKKAHDLLDSKTLFLADGHHRYEAALAYRDAMRDQHPGYTGKEQFNYVLMYFTNMETQGMLIRPTHRLIGRLQDFQVETFLSRLRHYFEVETVSFALQTSQGRGAARDALAQRGQQRHTLGFYFGGDDLLFLSLRDDRVMDQFFDAKSPKVLRLLDVSVLHRLVLEELLQLTPESGPGEVSYVRSFDEAIAGVQRGERQFSVLLNPTCMKEVRDVANAGEKMPQKSSYFDPKLLSGLVFQKIALDETIAS
ncbi:MAG: DUF1015 domain-containing protein [Trichloromonadaceae bacterium]